MNKAVISLASGLLDRYAAAGGRFLVRPICLDARKVDRAGFAANAEAGGTVQLWAWSGEDSVVTFSY